MEVVAPVGENSNALYRILGKYIDRPSEDDSNHKWKTGLMPIAIPTGTSKTYTMCQWICEYSLREFSEESPRRPIIVFTSLNNVLPEKELHDAFESRGRLDLYNELFLRLPSTCDVILEKYDKSMDDDIRYCVGESNAKKFINAVKTCLNAKKPYLEMAEEKLRSKVEPAFRHVLKKRIKDQFSSYDARFKAVTKNPQWSWVSVLYPSVYTLKRSIFFLSADKFLLGNDQIITKSSSMFSSKILADAIVFIDEFDAVKTTFLNRIIDQNLRYHINSLELFEIIRVNLPLSHPDLLYSALGNEKHEEKSRKSEASLIKRFDRVEQAFSTAYSMKMSPECMTSNLTLFHSRKTMLLDGGYKKHYRATPTKRKQLMIEECIKEDANLVPLFSEVYWAIEAFARHVSFLAFTNYKEYRESGNFYYSYEDLIRSALREYRISGESKEYLTNYILMHTNSPVEFDSLDNSFYQVGYKYNSILDDMQDPLHSDVHTVWQDLTPEMILLHICNSAFVIGLSATAKLPTVLDNFDLEYLSSVIGDRFIDLKEEEEDLQRFVDGKWVGYENVDIRPSFIEDSDQDGNYDPRLWEMVIKDKDNLRFVLDSIKNQEDYFKKRYLRAARVMYEFITNDDLYAFIAFFNKLADTDQIYDSNFDSVVLELIFNCIYDEHNPSHNYESPYKEMVFVVCSDNAMEMFGKYSEILSEGRKALVLTTYNSLSAGQNIQFEFRGKTAFVRIGTEDRKVLTKDFDAVYLDKPTNIIPQLSADDPNILNTIQSIIFKMKYLQNNGEISTSQFYSFLSKVLWRQDEEFSRDVKPLLISTRSGRYSAARSVIQATGRISRTILKNPVVRVYADPALRSVFTEPTESYNIVNRESSKLISMISACAEQTSDEHMYANKAVIASENVLDYIHTMMNFEIESNRELWEALRDFVFHNPTTDDLNIAVKMHYLELPRPMGKVWFKSEKEWKGLEYRFEPTFGFETVSEESARLADINKIPGIEELLGEMYPLKFKPARFIMTGPLYKEIYKAYLGELVGDFILNKYVETEKMPDGFYEKFDMMTKKAQSYVDYKFWNDDSFMGDRVSWYRKHIVNKLKLVGGKVAYILNLFKINDQMDVEPVTVDGVTVVYSYLWDAKTNQPNETLFDYMMEVQHEV